MVVLWLETGRKMRHGKIGEDKIKGIEIMEEVKEKAIELLLDIISKEDFEMMLYEKVKSEDLIKNSLLFELVNINYRLEGFKKPLLEILRKEISEEVFIIYNIKLYSEKIKDENNTKTILHYFSKIYNLFDFDQEYSLMWDFYNINEELDLVEFGYENESEVIMNLKKICSLVCKEFDRLSTLSGKVTFLINGFEKEDIEILSIKNKFMTKTIPHKKWYEFWK
ncbi:hypothetical protein FDT66_05920 [Polaribacter aestuariivivens]|uniref:Uncharacterized protein n=2 Tax=Polaribacter aestuariivivens TaxID=2304626 RepID=A0A5S3N8H6_9FLAO|nr:hypothetical protein FDT66_05920 [Polaribacter aestuariivivens]